MSTNINKKRLIRNAVMIIAVIALAVGVFFTAKSISSSSVAQMPQMSNTQMNGDGSNSSNQTPPQKPDGDTNGGTSSDNSSQNSNSDSQNSAPPQMPSNDSSNQSNDSNSQSSDSSNDASQQNDSQNSNDTSSANSGANEQQANPMPNNQNVPQNTPNSFNYKYIILAVLILLICAVLIYLVMSRFNKYGFKKTLKNADKILIYVMTVIIATSACTGAGVYAINHTSSQSQIGGGNASQSVSASGATEVDGESLTLGDTYTSQTSDESAILVSNSGKATITSATVNKSGGDSSNTENSEFYGVNSGILVQENSTATIKDTKITTSAKGSNAVFSTGENSKIYISDSTITTTGESSSRGLDATYGGYIEADNVNITTQGGSCATLATDRGEGTVIAKNSTLETNGTGSPLVYSTGDITVSNSTGTANGSQMVVVEGKNSASVSDSTLTASANGNRGDTDVSGVMIYQSMSGDAGEGTGTFTSENSTLSITKDSDYYESAPMFFVTNTDAVINLTNTKLSFGSGTLLDVKGTDEWGTSGSNGGNVEFNATNQTLLGDIEADDISTVSLNLTSSSFEGSINNSNSAKEISLTLDKNSTVKLTADTYVTSLDDADTSYSNIDFNGYTLYVNSKAIN